VKTALSTRPLSIHDRWTTDHSDQNSVFTHCHTGSVFTLVCDAQLPYFKLAFTTQRHRKVAHNSVTKCNQCS